MQGRARAAADRLITRHGGAALLVQQGAVPLNPWDPPATLSETPVQIVETGATDDYQPATLVQAGDRVGVMAVPASVTPSLSDRLKVGGLEFALLELTAMQPDPGGVIVAYRYHARR